MQENTTEIISSLDLKESAQAFISELAGQSERKKKPLPSYPGMQVFFLYIRAKGHVPPHKVTGAITVQTIIGEATFTVEGRTISLPQGSIVSLAPDVPHELDAQADSVLLVTHAVKA